jgi:uncharacterized protein
MLPAEEFAMRWQDGRQSSNVEDRRGMGGGTMLAGGGIGTLVIALLYMFLGGGGDGGGLPLPQPGAPAGQTSAQDDEQSKFVKVVLADTEDVWNALFKQQFGGDYREPRLVLFEQMDRSACGLAQAAMGPFYCPVDQTVYIDLSFYRELQQRFQAPGDFAQAYVIAHEVGHHVQTMLGISEKVHNARQRSSEEEGNALSVRLELQADCFAGVWAHHAQKQRNILEPGDVEEALNAASAIGDDRMQRQTQGRAIPETFTHGTSEQRVRWFRSGFESGDVQRCDTFQGGSI